LDYKVSEDFLAKYVAIVCCLCGLLWSAMYYYIFGLGLTMFLPLLFVVIVSSALIISIGKCNFTYVIYALIACITWISAFIQWSIGDIHESGLVVSWSFLGPIGASIFLTKREAYFWLSQFMLILIISVYFNPDLVAHDIVVPTNVINIFYLMNVGIASLVVFMAATRFVNLIQLERQKSDNLLENMLPLEIANQLKRESGVIAKSHDSASILFADIVGFTNYSAGITPETLVTDLNELFSEFDLLVAKYDIEKIKTIGDAYMVCAGAPKKSPDHANRIVEFAIEMLAVAQSTIRHDNLPFDLRIGIHSGTITAGVIGTSKYVYDLWGDAVNIASRMESSGVPGKIQISDTTRKLIELDYKFEARGPVEIKGKGKMDTFIVSDRR